MNSSSNGTPPRRSQAPRATYRLQFNRELAAGTMSRERFNFYMLKDEDYMRYFARALAVNAGVILMDEPFSAVDEQTRRKFQEDLLDLIARERKTFIFVTHSIEEAVYVSSRVVLLSARPGTVADIIDVAIPRGIDPDAIRRYPVYLDPVESIWRSLKRYLE